MSSIIRCRRLRAGDGWRDGHARYAYHGVLLAVVSALHTTPSRQDAPLTASTLRGSGSVQSLFAPFGNPVYEFMT